MSGFNNAIRYNLLNAVSGSYPAYEVDCSLALVSRGELSGGQSPTAQSTTAGTVAFQWSNNSGVGKPLPTDTSLLVVYCPSRNQCVYTTLGAVRSTGSATLSVPSFSGLSVQTYLGFVSADGKAVASSSYTGELTVA
jgi:hypothetical protein